MCDLTKVMWICDLTKVKSTGNCGRKLIRLGLAMPATLSLSAMVTKGLQKFCPFPDPCKSPGRLWGQEDSRRHSLPSHHQTTQSSWYPSPLRAKQQFYKRLSHISTPFHCTLWRSPPRTEPWSHPERQRPADQGILGSSGLQSLEAKKCFWKNAWKICALTAV